MRNANLIAFLVLVSGVLTLAASPLYASTETVRLARLKYSGGGDWYSNPTSLPNLMKAIGKRTQIPLETLKEARVELLDEDLFNYPFLYMNGHGDVRFSQGEIQRLREYLERGGFLWADDNYGMDRSFRRELSRVFPDASLVELPFDHEVFHAFYSLPEGTPKVHEHDGNPAQSLGLFYQGRLVVLYTYEADIGDGLEDAGIHNDPEAVREAAMRYAVNAVVYAMTH